MKIKFTLFFMYCSLLITYAQVDQLQSGPMVSYTTMTETLLWVQTKTTAEVQIHYWNEDTPNTVLSSHTITTKASEAFVAHIVLDNLTPGTTYHYKVLLNAQEVKRPYPLQFETLPLWQWRTDPPDFSFALGSCTYINETPYDRPGKPYGDGYQIFEHIRKKSPNFMIWSGDNTYLREADWNSTSGILHRYTHTRSTPELQALLASTHHYATWDDHDYGPDNADRSFHQKKNTAQAFKLFYPSPTYIFDEGVTSFFQWSDCDFFVLDDRYWRTPHTRTDLEGQILGASQVTWLLDALSSSTATFKCIIVGGQFLNPTPAGERFAKSAPKERAHILAKIKALQIEGVVFFSGDVHYTELSKLDTDQPYPIYDLTVSPLTAGPMQHSIPKNSLQVPETLVQKRNFAHITVAGKDAERHMNIAIYDNENVLQWEKKIYATSLTIKK